MESCDPIGVGTVDDLAHVFSVPPLGLLGLLQHQRGFLGVLAGTGSQELRSPVEPHPLPTRRWATRTGEPPRGSVDAKSAGRRRGEGEGEGKVNPLEVSLHRVMTACKSAALSDR